MLLAAIGLYGVLSYAVVQRSAEIGVRMALGAKAGNVVRAVLCNALALATLGVLLGLVGALGFTRLLASLLFGVAPMDPMTFACVALMLLIVTIAASAAPALRAARVDPLTALRGD